MKILAVNLYSNKQQVQSRPAFGDSTDIGGCEPSRYEIRLDLLKESYYNSRSRILESRLEAILSNGREAAKEYDRELEKLKNWFLKEQQALKEEFGLVTKKPSFFKKLFHIK